MDFNRAVGYVLLSPFSQGHLSSSDNTVQENQIYHTSPQPCTLMQDITIQQARVQLPPQWSFHARAAPALVRVLPMTLSSLFPSRPTDTAQAHVAAQERHWGIKSHHRARCWFIHCFQQDCRGEPEGSFWLRNRNLGYLFICNDSDGRPRGQLIIPLSHALLAPNRQQAGFALCSKPGEHCCAQTFGERTDSWEVAFEKHIPWKVCPTWQDTESLLT